MMKRLLGALLAILAGGSLAYSQIGPPPGGGGAGGGGITSLSTFCPSSGPYTTSAVTLGSVLAQATQATGYTIAASDCGTMDVANSSSAIAWSLPQAGSSGFLAGYTVVVMNEGAGTLTITPTTSPSTASRRSSSGRTSQPRLSAMA